jgi:hypothetical protein
MAQLWERHREFKRAWRWEPSITIAEILAAEDGE